MTEIFQDEQKKIFIKAKSVYIGKGVTFGKSIDIRLNGDFKIGDRSHLGNDVHVRGNNVIIGADLYHSEGLVVGGSGYQYASANLIIGDRCTIHNNKINIFKDVILGNDVGLSPEVVILTHGYWLSVLKGFPAKFAGVNIRDGAIVGYRTLIMMGVTIGEGAVVGGQSVVTKDLQPYCIYAGNPAKLIRKVEQPSREEKVALMKNILEEYKKNTDFQSVSPNIELDYPKVKVNKCVFDVEDMTFQGEEDVETDDFRDYVRKWGLRFYSERPFKSIGSEI